MLIHEYFSDTIAAIATPPGPGAIAVIRISGDNAVPIVRKIWRGKDISSANGYTLFHGYIFDAAKQEDVDEVLISIFRKPKSFTGEDMVEISCHGGYVVPKYIIRLLTDLGIRPALPGEFTKRAFLNGKIDLIQAEAINAIVRSRNYFSAHQALSRIEKQFSNFLNECRHKLIELLALIEVHTDYPEDELEEDEICEANVPVLKEIISRLETIIQDSEKGQVLLDGIRIGIAGKPNVGKSSLLNCFAREPRAIVSHIPGTTRDFIEVSVNLGMLPATILDTAGIRKTDEEIENIGQQIAIEKLMDCDLILLLFDGSQPLTDEDFDLLEKIQADNSLIVINKCDLPVIIQESDILNIAGKSQVFRISAKTGYGIDLLEKEIEQITLGKEFILSNQQIFCNNRHLALIQKMELSLKNAVSNIENSESPEFTAIEIRDALNCLGEIVGQVYTDDILNHIFNNFCVGK